MQGYILRVQKVRDEDCIVAILTSEALIEAYRFYGARHPVITQGFKLDFELVHNMRNMPHLRGTMHLGFSYLADRSRLAAWQSFMRVLWEHLKGVGEVDEFYYNLLEEMSLKICRQNPKRVIIEAYLKILDFEGRLADTSRFDSLKCFCCEQNLLSGDGDISIARGFLLAHPWCIGKSGLSANSIKRAFENGSVAHLDDEAVNSLYFTVLEGL